jgi:hypothetical protein
MQWVNTTHGVGGKAGCLVTALPSVDGNATDSHGVGCSGNPCDDICESAELGT